ncbi:hypothetical protein D3C73_1582610 [compost metagenome]
MGLEAEIFGCGGRPLQVLHGPFLPRLRIAPHFRDGEAIGQGVIDRVNGDQLADNVAGQFGDLEPVLGDGSVEIIGIGL